MKVITEPFGSEYIAVNGVNVRIGNESAVDRSFRVTDVSNFIIKGENYIDITLQYEQSDYVYYVLYGGVSESLRNCLVFDTEIENIYLFGDFRLDMRAENFTNECGYAYRYNDSKDMALAEQRAELNVSNIVTDGYPFYCGEIALEGEYMYEYGDPTVLYLDGRYSTAHIFVNGAFVGKLIFDKHIDLKGYLKDGSNRIRVILCNNYRNLLGPHHQQIAEPMSVSPITFSFENQWMEGKCEKFNAGYSFVRFGAEAYFK